MLLPVLGPASGLPAASHVEDPLFCLSGVLSPAECASVVAWAEAAGFDEAPINGALGPVRRPSVRNNARVMVDDPAFAAALWGRVRAAFGPWPGLGGQPVGLNERLRIYRYDPGMYFKPHTDGAFHRPDGSERSLQTLMVYLNEGFEGGQTRFLQAGVVVQPRIGTACVFWHRQLHEGCTVLSGRKYALRTDVMYG